MGSRLLAAPHQGKARRPPHLLTVPLTFTSRAFGVTMGSVPSLAPAALAALLTLPGLATEEPEAAKKPAYVEATSSSGAEVYLGERLLGRPPFGQAVPPGEYEVRIVHADGKVVRFHHTLAPGGKLVIDDWSRRVMAFTPPRRTWTDDWSCRRSGHLPTAVDWLTGGETKEAAQSVLRGIQEAGLCADDYATLTAVYAHIRAASGEATRCTRAFETVRAILPSYRPDPAAPEAVHSCFEAAEPARLGLKSHRFVTRDGQRYLEGEVDDPERLVGEVEVRIRAGKAAEMTVRQKLTSNRFSIPLADIAGATYRLGLVTALGPYLDWGHEL